VYAVFVFVRIYERNKNPNQDFLFSRIVLSWITRDL
jgi:hypothetical protein